MDEIKKQNLIAAVEAILFVYGEPLSIKKIAKILSKKSEEKVNEQSVKDAIAQLEQKYLSEDGGIKLLQVSSGSDTEIQLASKPEFSSFLEDFIKEEFKEQLTPASLEVLALVMYFGPIAKSQIDYWRGVNSSFILRNLLMRGLVDRFVAPKKDNVHPLTKRISTQESGNENQESFPETQKNNYSGYGAGVYLYQSSFDLLKYLGISKVEELPDYLKFKATNSGETGNSAQETAANQPENS
jgi:segregation and condensation protein B